MFKTTRAYFNAIKEGKYSKKIKLYDTTENSSKELDSSNSEVQKLQELIEDDRYDNLSTHLLNMGILTVKKAVALAPFILGGFTIVSFNNGKYIKNINVDNVCEEKNIEFDENSVLSMENKNYALTFLPKNYVDDNITSKSYVNFDQSSYATIYYGQGSDSLQAKFSINEDNTWEYSDYTNYLYQINEDYVNEPIGEIDIEYKKIIEEATESFINQAELSEEEISYVRELVSNNENDIVVKIKQFINLGDANLDVHSYHWFRCLLLLVAEIILIIFYIKKLDEIFLADDVKVKDNCVDYTLDDINIFIASKKYKKVFLDAEKERISEIIELLKSYSGDEKITAKYEKRLNLLVKDNFKK